MRFVPTRLLTVLIACAVVAPLDAQSRDGEALRRRMGAYIATFIERFSSVVAEETYTQQTSSPRRKRALKSDYLLVRFPGADGWHQFRDTFEVDGTVVRTEPERLTRLFVEPPENALRRASEIAQQSARHNLTDFGTINTPLLTLALLQAQYHERFRFTMSGIEKSLGPDVRVMQFTEFVRPTILRLDANGDLFSRGLVWVDESTGRVRRTELRFGQVIRQRVDFGFDDGLGLDVPVATDEFYPSRMGEVTAKATYSRFRRFQVNAEETLK